jgi:CubicO group peptidase (beta-lactamase class C family)
MVVRRRAGRSLSWRPARLALVMAFLAPACTTPTASPTSVPAGTGGPAVSATTDCGAFGPDSSYEFFTPTNVSYDDPTPLEWPTGSPANVGLDEAALNSAAENVALSPDVQSLLIVRHGRLAFERYFNGSSASEANTIASASKSILSVATGIAIEDGLLELESRIDAFLAPDLVGQHGDLTVEQLLTMSGGLAHSEDPTYLDDVGPGDRPQTSFVREVLKWERVDPAGSKFAYSTGLTQVLGAVLAEATGRSLCEYVADRVLGPLGIDVEHWWVEPDGDFAAGHSVFITPRELARFGQLVLDGGAWAGRQVVPSTWLDRSLAERWDLGCKPGLGAHQGYGFLWWLYDANGYRVWNASGYGGQEVWIAPDLDVVIVLTHDATRVYEPGHHELSPGAVARAAIFPTTEPPRAARCPSREFQGATIRPDGTGRDVLPDWPGNGIPTSWSGDGARLAIQLDRRDLNAEIYTVSPDGTSLRRVTRDLAHDFLATFSPDGKRIAFARGEPSSTDLYLVDGDGGEPVRLTDFEGFEHSPIWSPDGARIAFVSGQGDVRSFGETGELWAMDPDGSRRERLLDRPVGYLAWSPDGRRIALELRDDGHIGVLDLETGALADVGPGRVPKWSPDGERLVFIRDAADVWDIYTMRADGSQVVQLTDDAAFDTFPIWSPDGQTILFVSAPAE